MSKEGTYIISTSPQFDRLVQPLTEEEKNKLIEDILEKPDDQIIRTWRGKHLIDKDRYEICVDLELNIKISEQFFEDWIDAAIYICQTQLEERTLRGKYPKYLIGQIYHYKLLKESNSNKADYRTILVESVGEKWNLSASSVYRYNALSEAVNEIFGQSENLARKILAEELIISVENIVEISRLKQNEIKFIEKTIETENIVKVSLPFIRNEVKLCHIQVRGVVSRKEKKEIDETKNAGIRQMPKYDPDSEVNSLCMTIESWISSIQRVKESDNFGKITEKASMLLMKRLSALEFTVNNVQEALVERTRL